MAPSLPILARDSELRADFLRPLALGWFEAADAPPVPATVRRLAGKLAGGRYRGTIGERKALRRLVRLAATACPDALREAWSEGCQF